MNISNSASYHKPENKLLYKCLHHISASRRWLIFPCWLHTTHYKLVFSDFGATFIKKKNVSACLCTLFSGGM